MSGFGAKQPEPQGASAAELLASWAWLLCRWLFDPLAEANEIAEGFDHSCFKHPPRHRFEAGLHVWVILEANLALKRLDPIHHHPHMNAGIAVAVMLAYRLPREIWR
jgi:hypothetical protein